MRVFEWSAGEAALSVVNIGGAAHWSFFFCWCFMCFGGLCASIARFCLAPGIDAVGGLQPGCPVFHRVGVRVVDGTTLCREKGFGDLSFMEPSAVAIFR